MPSREPTQARRMNGVSLVLATVGRTGELRRMLASLVEQAPGVPLEVLIVDQNPDERLQPTIAFAREQGLDVKHLRQSLPNLSQARNRGIDEARYDLIAFPDDDCWYGEGTLRVVLAEFLEDAGLGGVTTCWAEQVPQPSTNLELSLAEARCFSGPHISSITLFLRREIFEVVGRFDTRLGVGRWYGAGEENDLLLRALTAGFRLRYVANAFVHHHHDPDSQIDWRRHCGEQRRRARGLGAIYVKHALSPYVALRGLLAPLFKPLLQGAGWRNWLLGAATTLGRVEGMVRWSLFEHPQ